MAPVIDTVLFDLDGTLADTAPDLANALNALRSEHALPPLPFSKLRPLVSRGADALVRIGLNITEGHPERQMFREQLLAHYRQNLAVESTLMPGIPELLARLDELQIRWGIVTNKPAWLTDPLLDALKVSARTCCVVSGDTATHAKPHPAPMFEAMRLSGTTPDRTLYVGDAQSDVQAARAANVTCLVMLYGYIGPDELPYSWGADAVLDEPGEILEWIGCGDGKDGRRDP